MAKEIKKGKEKYIIAVLAFILIGITIFIFFRRSSTNKPVEVLFDEYQELESAYSKALSDIEKLSDEEYKDIEDMQKQLKSKVSELKKNKNRLDISHKESEELYEELAKNLENYDARKRDSLKGEGSVVFEGNRAGELVYSSEDVDKIISDNEELKKRNKDLEKNISTVKIYYEKEKANNAKLNAQVSEVSRKIDKMKSEGKIKDAEVKKLLDEKAKYEKELRTSDKTISKQNTKINKLVVTLRKVNVNCSFIFEKGSPDKEMKVFLTDEGLSKIYYDYFKSKKPAVSIKFKLNKDLFKAGTEKISLKIYNSQKNEIYSANKTVSKSELTISIPGKVFGRGAHSVVLKSGAENLIIGGSYTFKIGK